MATRYILDTHALVWHLEGNRLLGRSARAIIDDPASDLVLPIIALAEAAFIVEKGRTAIPTVSDLIADVQHDDRIEIFPLTDEIFSESIALTNIPEMHDRLIVATGVHLHRLGDDIHIITKDSQIIPASPLPVVW